MFISLRVRKCGNPHFHTSWYKILYDTRAKKRFLDKCDYITRLRLVLQTRTRQKTFHRTRIVMYYYCQIRSKERVVSIDRLKPAFTFLETSPDDREVIIRSQTDLPILPPVRDNPQPADAQQIINQQQQPHQKEPKEQQQPRRSRRRVRFVDRYQAGFPWSQHTFIMISLLAGEYCGDHATFLPVNIPTYLHTLTRALGNCTRIFPFNLRFFPYLKHVKIGTP